MDPNELLSSTKKSESTVWSLPSAPSLKYDLECLSQDHRHTIAINRSEENSLVPCTLIAQPELQLVPSTQLGSFWSSLDRSVETNYNMALDRFFQNESILTILDNIKEIDSSLGKAEHDSQALVPYSPIGYVYAAWNPLFKDLIKIGATMRQPYVRVAELSGTGVPEPFQLITFVLSTNPFKLEREIHLHFNAVRKYGRKKEFFVLSKDQILEHFHLCSILQVQTKVVEQDDDKSHKKKKQKSSDLMETEYSFEEAVRHYVTNYIIPADCDVFISTQQIQSTFATKKYATYNSNRFACTLANQISRVHPSAKSKKTKTVRGYCGITFK